MGGMKFIITNIAERPEVLDAGGENVEHSRIIHQLNIVKRKAPTSVANFDILRYAIRPVGAPLPNYPSILTPL
jgi:hypothetical protein